MNRIALWSSIIVGFCLVTTASFCVGKYVLGERLLNKPHIETRYSPGDPPAGEADHKQLAQTDGVRDMQPFAGTDPRGPRVTIEVKPSPTKTKPAMNGAGSPAASPEAGQPEASPAAPTPATEKKPPAPAKSAPKRGLPPPHADEATPSESDRPATGGTTLPESARANGKAAVRTQARVPPPADPPRDSAFRVQVGLFTARENADVHAAQLQKRGYPVVTVAEERDGQTVYRVNVGPYRTRDTAAKVKQELAEQGFDGFVPQ